MHEIIVGDLEHADLESALMSLSNGIQNHNDLKVFIE